MTVGEVARTAGVTVRTLHHGDAVGLLVPTGRGAAGYRVDGPADVERLVRVLAHRALGLGLEEVRRLLDDPDADVVGPVDRQHAQLVDRIAHLEAVAELVRRTREARRTGIELDAEELREVFGDDDPGRHAQEAQDRWGDTDAHRQPQGRTRGFGKADRVAVRQQVEQRFAELLAAVRSRPDRRPFPRRRSTGRGSGASTTARTRCTAAWPSWTRRTSGSRPTTTAAHRGSRRT